ncbi:mediator of RNA polymerase II transcription subunit 22-like [Oncorhynchus masou masou]|uniref:mediator of RNA polymerase II transcription subunit 22-like n=1 Tax=Oncorhynchus masou masou TaxID=90313 RepID=UPI003184613A
MENMSRVAGIFGNFSDTTWHVEDETQVSRATQAEQNHYEMCVWKQFLILNDFPSVNEAINLQNQQLRSLQEECDKKLTSLRDEIAIDLYELEEEYYSSSYSQWDSTDLPLCEAYRRRDIWASPDGGDTSRSAQEGVEDTDGPTSQETTPKHNLNGHGTTGAIDEP